MWEQLVRARGGEVARDVSELASAARRKARFVAIELADDGPLPLIAKLAPAAAVAFALLGAERDAAGAAAAASADDALAALSSGEVDVYLLKRGRVGGGVDERGSRPVEADQVAAALDAVTGGSVRWERDPDFGYLVAADVPGISSDALGMLLPRLLYRRADRVYEHAALVPDRKRERRERLAAVGGLAEEILDSVG